MSVFRKTGMVDIQKVAVDSTSVFEIGDLCSSDESAGDIIVGITNVAVKGITMQASVTGNTDQIRVDVLHPGDRVVIDVSTGTPSSTDQGKFADLDDQNSLDITATTNKDCRIYFNGTTDTVDATFTTLETAGPDTA